ncbi:hypothetical protein R3P38DRAFT_3102347 [Favolaschia claudopus]|uniref:Uncharacterized protein n=1 Tax=Favolaschia claudopus TaxID=2862362 RepID=A0AAV9ZL36_9AGAR
MKSAFLLLVFSVTAAIAAGVKIPGEGAYSVSNLRDLPDEPTSVTQPLANQVLDVLEKYGLTKNFGVVGVHTHVSLAPGQVMFQHGNSTFTHQEIEVYDDVRSDGVPYTYRITTDDAIPQLLPLDLGEITPNVLAARSDLAAAMANKAFLQEFAATASGHLAGIAYIRPLDRMALEHSEVVKNHYNAEKTAGNATAISLAAVESDDAPSFFTRGVGNSTAVSEITVFVPSLSTKTSKLILDLI